MTLSANLVPATVICAGPARRSARARKGFGEGEEAAYDRHASYEPRRAARTRTGVDRGCRQSPRTERPRQHCKRNGVKCRCRARRVKAGGVGEAENTMAGGSWACGRASSRYPAVMAAQFKGSPIGRAGRIRGEPCRRGSEGDTVKEEREDEDACGKSPPPAPLTFCHPIHQDPVSRENTGVTAWRANVNCADQVADTTLCCADDTQDHPPGTTEPQAHPPWPAEQDSSVSGRSRTRSRAEPPFGHQLCGALHIPGVHAHVPGDRTAGFRDSCDRLRAKPVPRRVEIFEALSQQLPQSRRIP